MTVVVDVAGGQLLEVVPGRDRHAAVRWLLDQGEGWLGRIRWACLDLSGSYRATFDAVVPDAVQVAERWVDEIIADFTDTSMPMEVEPHLWAAWDAWIT